MSSQATPRGIVRQNPVFVMFLGLCPALAITTTVVNALTMGLAVLFVLLAAGIVLSLLRTTLPRSLSPYAEMVIIAVFVTVVELFLSRFAPRRAEDLGIYLPLIAMNCIILNQAKGSALRKTSAEASVDGLFVGVGFLGSLCLISLIREVLGAGIITLFPIGSFGGVIRIASIAEAPARVMVLAVGAFLVVGYLMALFNVVGSARLRRLQIREERMRDSAQRTTMEGTTGGHSS